MACKLNVVNVIRCTRDQTITVAMKAIVFSPKNISNNIQLM